MANCERFGMQIVTAESSLDEVLTAMFNKLRDKGEAQSPLHGGQWRVRSNSVQQRRLTLDSKWGGRLIEVRWKTDKYHVLPYTSSADGFETWIDVDLGRNRQKAEASYESIVAAARGKVYTISGLLGMGQR